MSDLRNSRSGRNRKVSRAVAVSLVLVGALLPSSSRADDPPGTTPGPVAAKPTAARKAAGTPERASAPKRAPKSEATSAATDILSRIENGDIEATFTPRGAYRLEVQLVNRRNQPISVSFPPGLVADTLPLNAVLAQSGSGSGGAGSQAMAFIESPGLELNAQAKANLNIATVCMNYGLPEPGPNVLAHVKTAAEYSNDPRMARLLTLIAMEGNVPMPAAQAAVWHLSNRMPFHKLRGEMINHVGRIEEREIRIATRLVEAASSPSMGGGSGVKAASPSNAIHQVSVKAEMPMVIAVNPDPRGGKVSPLLARAILGPLRERLPEVEVTTRNYIAEPFDAADRFVQWSLLVGCPGQDLAAAARSTPALSLMRSEWNPKTKSWKHEKVQGARIDPGVAEADASSEGPGALARVMADGVLAEIISRSVQVEWSAGQKKMELTVTNRLSVPLTALTLAGRAKGRGGDTVNLADLELAPGKPVKVPVNEEAAQRLAKLNKLVAIGAR
jgi:hypothetical protein